MQPVTAPPSYPPTRLVSFFVAAELVIIRHIFSFQVVDLLALASFFLFCFVFRDRVSRYSPGCPGTQFVDQAGLELRNPPASACQVLVLKACATTARLSCSLLNLTILALVLPAGYLFTYLFCSLQCPLQFCF